jgi:hypothetical protein
MFADFALHDGYLAKIYEVIQWVTGKFPMRSNRELIPAEQGSDSTRTGNVSHRSAN